MATSINWLSMSGIIVDIILFFIVAGNAVIGYRRGLAKVLFSFVSTIIAIVLVFILYRPTTNYIINNTKVPQKLESVFEENLKNLFEKNNIQTTEQAENSTDTMGLLKVFVGNEIGDLLEETTDSLINYISVQVSYKVISIVVFFSLFAIIRLVLYILRSYVDLVANLPVIRVFNGSGGMIYGIIRGFFVIYLTFGVISIIMPMMGDNIIIVAIQKASIGSKMFNNNIILNFIFKFI